MPGHAAGIDLGGTKVQGVIVDKAGTPLGSAVASTPGDGGPASVVDQVASVVPFAPTDPLDAVRLNAAVHLGAGVLLAAGVMSRLAALALAVSMVPTTVAGHRFWEIDDPVKRQQQRTQFLKNTAILGGLLVVALD